MLKTMLKPEFIFSDVKIDSLERKEAIEKISSFCEASTGISASTLAEKFMDRENLDSTGFGNGVAIPHAKIPNLKNPMVAVTRFADGIEWDAIDGEPVKVAIALIMPDGDEANTHLQVIAQLSRKLVHQETIDTLVNEVDSMKLYNFIINEM